MSGALKPNDPAADRIEAEAGAAPVSKLSPEDAALDAQWRAAFGQPLPLLGAAPIVKMILADNAVDPGKQSLRRGPPARPALVRVG